MFIPFEIEQGTIWINKEWAASVTLKAFIEHEKHHGIPDEKMKEIWSLCKQEEKPSEKSE